MEPHNGFGQEGAMIGLMNHIAGVDQTVFHLINGVWTNPFLDRAMPASSWIGNLGAVCLRTEP
jgi:hypothetical protein